ncbi:MULTISPECIES: hypothetical protein [unclassified Methylobacterium]|jgi:hypothetical protein|uniref:hypothetical protein n=1 Tax=unclassified Methylobacterium TaxID=2615210 RepID=UPI0008F1DA4B|nr:MULTISPECIES: hypothetical protein [unclassified Methylobacterium]SFU67872.1 hypothetical protein SAMN02799643_01767 [Methylobacterium sp. UNCCL125]
MTDITNLSPGPGHIPAHSSGSLPTLADLIEANRKVTSYAARQDRARNLPDLPKPHALVAGQAQYWRERALGQRRQLLSTPAAEKAAAAVRAAFSGPQHPPVTLMLVAQLLDCYPADKLNNPEAFFQTLAFDLDDAGYSNATIAAACMDLRRTSKFRPSIAEVLERCEAKRAYAMGVHAGHDRYAERLRAVHLTLHHTGGDPDPQESAAYSPCPDEPLIVAEYAKGSTNEWWYDLDLNTDLMFRQTEAGEETPEEWRARFHRMKAEAAADPEALRLRIEGAHGAQVGRHLAWTYHRRSGLGRKQDAIKELERLSLARHPHREPEDLYFAWLAEADKAFRRRFAEFEPNYIVDEARRYERDARERAEREARLKQYRTPSKVRA